MRQRYTSNLVKFLNHTMVIKLYTKRLNPFIRKMKSVGVDFPYTRVEDLEYVAEREKFLLEDSFGKYVYVEYDYSKGFCLGWEKHQDIIDWFGEDSIFTF